MHWSMALSEMWYKIAHCKIGRPPCGTRKVERVAKAMTNGHYFESCVEGGGIFGVGSIVAVLLLLLVVVLKRDRV